MPDIGALLAAAKPREIPVRMCLAGDLAGEVERLAQELALAGEDWVPGSIADVNPQLELVRQIEEAREGMRAASVEFRLRAMGSRAYRDLIALHPAPASEKGQPYDAATFLPALVAASCVDPVMSVEQVGQLLDLVNDGQAQVLFASALAVNEEPSPLPF